MPCRFTVYSTLHGLDFSDGSILLYEAYSSSVLGDVVLWSAVARYTATSVVVRALRYTCKQNAREMAKLQPQNCTKSPKNHPAAGTSILVAPKVTH